MASNETEQEICELIKQVKELADQRKYAESLRLARRAWELAHSLLGYTHRISVTSLCWMGYLFWAMGDLAGARPYYEQALAIRRRVLGEEHVDTVATLSKLGQLLRAMGDLDAARPLHEETLAIRRRLLGADHPDTVASLNSLGHLLTDMGELAAARPCLEQAVAIRRRVLGENHLDTGISLNDLTVLLYRMGDLAAARPYVEQALAISRHVLGDNHPTTAQGLENLGMLLKDLGELSAARTCLEQAVAIRRRVLGEDHHSTAISHNNIGSLLQTMGYLAEARPHHEQALAISRRVLGEDHPDTATCHLNLGGLLKAIGDPVGARPYLEQALAIRRRVLGENHPDIARCLGDLGMLLQVVGEWAVARPHLEQALAIRRRVLGEDHPDTAASLDNLGMLLQAMGEMAAALPYLEQALKVRRRVLGEEHEDTATSLNNLGYLLLAMGNQAGARTCFAQALAICRRVVGNDHPRTASSIHHLGRLLRTMGDLAGARLYYAEAMALCRRILGQEHPDTIRAILNFGSLLLTLGEWDLARVHLEQALALCRRVLGNEHPDTASSLNSLGLVLRATGNPVGARPYYKEALAIVRRRLGDDHPRTAISLRNLGFLEATSGRFDEALELLRQAIIIDDRMIGQVFSIGSDQQRLLFLRTLEDDQDRFLSLVYRHLSHSPEAVRSAFDLVLRRKALTAEALAAQRDGVLGGRYPHLRDSFEQLTHLRRLIAQKTLAGPASGETLAVHEQMLHQWRQEQQQRETDLARQIPEVNLEQQLRKADRRAIALGLDEGVALVEFVRFDVFDFHAMPARGERRWQPARYLAFVLPGGQPDQVQMIDLGEASPIDRMIADFRAGVAVDPRDRPARDIRRHRAELPPTAQGQVGPALRDAVFDKLVPALGGCKRLLLAPDGDLTRLPFEVLPDADGGLLLEQYAISYLSCGRDVLRFGAARSGQPTEPLVVADPLFDLAADAGASAAAALTRSRHSRDFKRSDYHFPRLPGTREEGVRVAELLGVRPWLDGAALEARLKERRSPRVLHLATHGFFLTDQEHDPNKESRALEMIGAEAGGVGRFCGPLPENPLLRSGLALAGAQTWLDGKALPPEAEDGLLTAEDVAGLDLLDTDLVVLSACDTGLGEVRTGEGVFGLRRAFTVAGARTLVMSLWKVPDEQTRELMIDFYRGVISGQGVADALRQAQLAMRRKHPDPYYWGAFICQGNPGPLAGG